MKKEVVVRQGLGSERQDFKHCTEDSGQCVTTEEDPGPHHRPVSEQRTGRPSPVSRLPRPGLPLPELLTLALHV